MRSRVLFLTIGLAACLAIGLPAQDKKNDAKQESMKKTEPAGAFGRGDYRLGPEDVIDVFVWKETELSTSVVVRPDGKVSLPLIGELEASGKTAAQLQSEIAGKLKQYLADPVVNVIVKEVNSPRISVLGQVRKPDVYRMKQKVTVLDAIAMAGGFTDFAKRDRVVILRNGSGSADHQRIKVNLDQAVKDGRNVLYLEPSDTIWVE